MGCRRSARWLQPTLTLTLTLALTLALTSTPNQALGSVAAAKAASLEQRVEIAARDLAAEVTLTPTLALAPTLTLAPT